LSITTSKFQTSEAKEFPDECAERNAERLLDALSVVN